jgi:surface antigen
MKRDNQISKLMAFVMVSMLAVPNLATAECDRQQSSGGGGEIIGTLVGAALGGLLGSRIGSGDGTKVAIGAGVVAGGFLGNRLGSSMDCNDQNYHQQTTQHALETQPAGTAASWNNPDSGHAGTVTPTRTYQRADGTYCRDYEQTVEVDGQVELATGTACRESDGTWRAINT